MNKQQTYLYCTFCGVQFQKRLDASTIVDQRVQTDEVGIVRDKLLVFLALKMPSQLTVLNAAHLTVPWLQCVVTLMIHAGFACHVTFRLRATYERWVAGTAVQV